jgi:four helix bundle protein
MGGNYEKLLVFQKSYRLVLDIYRLVVNYPREEKYRLADQMIRAAYSIPSNIVEGNSKRTIKDYLNFLYISRGSIHELKYFLLLSKDLYYLDEDQFYRLSERCDRVAKLLNGLINSLKEKKRS